MLRAIKAAALLFLMFILSGCAKPFSGGYGDNGLSREEFEHYVERVFLLQNRLTNEVMLLLLKDESASSHENILSAEHDMHEICSPLNEYATRSIDHQSVGILLMRNVEKSAVSCEQAAKHVDSLLRELP